MVRSKNISPSWSDVKTALLHFDRAGLRGLVQDLYTASKDNQAFLHARLGLGHDQLRPFKASISRSEEFLAFEADIDWPFIRSGDIHLEMLALKG